MMRAVLLRLLSAALVFGLLAIWGCDEGTSTDPTTETGTIGVYPRPITVALTWQLTGPNGYVHDGTGDEVIENLAPGDYELTWQDVSGWFLPNENPMAKVLAGGAITTFTGTYRQPSNDPEPGQVQINPEPNEIEAPWTLTGPEDLVETGAGDVLFDDMTAGDYTITWGDVDGYNTPLPEQQTLAEGQGITFVITYLSQESSALVMLPVEPGTFNLGSPMQDAVDPYEWPQHEVTLTRPFEVSSTEITWAQYVRIVGANPSYYYDLCPDCELSHPVENLSWLEAVEFCNALSLDEGLTPAYDIVGEDVTWDQSVGGYRLLTEAEWEYTCRSGTQSDLANGALTYTPSSCDYDERLMLIGWYCNNSGFLPHSVAQLDANAWGFHDMHGNVWEWVWDWSGSYDNVPVTLGTFYFSDGSEEELGSLQIIQFLQEVGDELMIRLTEVGATFHISSLDITTSEISFEYADFAGEVNLRVNDDIRYMGVFTDFPAAIAPGVTLAVTAEQVIDAAFGEGVKGVITLTGEITMLELGGETLLVDDMDILDSGTEQYDLDRLVDFNAMNLGFVYRPAIGSMPIPILMGCSVIDPIGPTSGTIHMMRGGGYANGARTCRSATRSLPDKGRYTGFRVARYAD